MTRAAARTTGAATIHVTPKDSGASRRNGTGNSRYREKESLGDERNKKKSSRGDVCLASSFGLSGDGRSRVSLPEVASITSKWQELPSLNDAASPAALIHRLTMSDDPAMSVSSSLIKVTSEQWRSTPPPQPPRKSPPSTSNGRKNIKDSKTSLALLSSLFTLQSTPSTPRNNPLVRSRPSVFDSRDLPRLQP